MRVSDSQDRAGHFRNLGPKRKEGADSDVSALLRPRAFALRLFALSSDWTRLWCRQLNMLRLAAAYCV
jgi:hypothetical protein